MLITLVLSVVIFVFRKLQRLPHSVTLGQEWTEQPSECCLGALPLSDGSWWVIIFNERVIQAGIGRLPNFMVQNWYILMWNCASKLNHPMIIYLTMYWECTCLQTMMGQTSQLSIILQSLFNAYHPFFPGSRRLISYHMFINMNELMLMWQNRMH